MLAERSARIAECRRVGAAYGIERGKCAIVITTGGRAGAELGKCKVMVSKPAAGAGARPDMTPKDMEEMIKAGKSLAPAKDPIPTRYATEKTSPLEAEISTDGESNVFEFNLVD